MALILAKRILIILLRSLDSTTRKGVSKVKEYTQNINIIMSFNKMILPNLEDLISKEQEMGKEQFKKYWESKLEKIDNITGDSNSMEYILKILK